MKQFPDGKIDENGALSSIYTYIWSKGSKDTVLRLLLALCLGEVIPVVTDPGLLTKIE